MILESAEDTRQLGYVCAGSSKAGDRIAVTGPLGSGKTTFVQGFLCALGVDAYVKSPTYALYHYYAGEVDIYHFDFYRLESRDVPFIGFEEIYNDHDTIILAEWPEKIPEYTRDWLWISLDYFKLYKRTSRIHTINTQRYGQRFKDVLL